MTIQLLFWVIFVVSLLFGGYSNRAGEKFGAWLRNDLIFWILIGLLGWQVFGPAIHK